MALVYPIRLPEAVLAEAVRARSNGTLLDPLTHTLTGAALANTRVAQGTRMALPTLLIAVNLPDIDVFSYFAGGDAALGFRRGWTHGILAMAVLPYVLAWLMVWIDRFLAKRWADPQPGADFGRLLPLAYVGVLSHPLLDWLNTYGIRLLMPFDDRWFYGDTLFIIDPWIWLGLGGTAFLCRSESWRGLVGWAVLAALATAVFWTGSAGHPTARIVWVIVLALLVTFRACGIRPTDRAAVARLAATTLVACLLYVLTQLASSELASSRVESQLPGLGIRATDVMTGPVPIRPLAHAVVIETDDKLLFGSFDWFARPRLRIDPRSQPRPDWSSPELAAAAEAHCLKGMMNWVRYPWVEVDSTSSGQTVHVMDGRYTRSRTESFGGASVRLRPDLSVDCGEPED